MANEILRLKDLADEIPHLDGFSQSYGDLLLWAVEQIENGKTENKRLRAALEEIVERDNSGRTGLSDIARRELGETDGTEADTTEPKEEA